MGKKNTSSASRANLRGMKSRDGWLAVGEAKGVDGIMRSRVGLVERLMHTQKSYAVDAPMLFSILQVAIPSQFQFRTQSSRNGIHH